MDAELMENLLKLTELEYSLFRTDEYHVVVYYIT